MAVKKYVANADTTITNAFKSNLTTRGTGSNMGAADSMEIFHIYGQSMVVIIKALFCTQLVMQTAQKT